MSLTYIKSLKTFIKGFIHQISQDNYQKAQIKYIKFIRSFLKCIFVLIFTLVTLKTCKYRCQRILSFLQSAIIFRITKLHFFHGPMPTSPPLGKGGTVHKFICKIVPGKSLSKISIASQIKVLQGHFHLKIQKSKGALQSVFGFRGKIKI